jgi:hypothetical protein
MKNVPSRPDKAKTHPRDARSVQEARERRAREPERHVVKPRGRDRLPHEARFDAVYDAVNVRWSGTLEADGITVKADAGGVMVLLGVLDAKFRARQVAAKLASDQHHHLADLACPACGTDSETGCIAGR